MDLTPLTSRVGDFAKDIRLNLSSVLSEQGAPELTLEQIAQVALASAYASRSDAVIAALQAQTASILNEAQAGAARTAASLMAMNNVYYRFLHLVGDKEYGTLPARLRMNAIASPGVPKVDFELMSLAVSAINGCGMCMESHAHELLKTGLSRVAVQSAVRIAAVVNAAAQAIIIGDAQAGGRAEAA